MVIAELQRGKVPTEVVQEVVTRLEAGEILALPTDTVYGLHVHAGKQSSIDRLREIKGIRNKDRPFTTLFSTVVDIGHWVKLPEGENRRRVLEAWPGPVTWVLPATGNVPQYLLGPDGTLGIRIPRHPLLRAVTTAMDKLVVSTSANFHRQPPATSRENFPPDLLKKLDGVIYELEPLSGRPSEVKRWTAAGPEVIRARMDEKTEETGRINILVVCSGNLCRSPMAEALLASRLSEAAPNRFVIRSAGTLAGSGNRASLPAIEIMRQRGINLSGHLSRSVTNHLMEWANLVFVMTPDHLGELHARFPDHTGKIYLLTGFPEAKVRGETGIDDPYGMDLDTYRKVADKIDENLDRILPHLIRRAGLTPET